jgi:hypothetical protein
MNDEDYELNISYQEQSHLFKFNSQKNNINDIIKFSQQKFKFTKEQIKNEIQFYIVLKDKTEMLIDDKDFLIDILMSQKGSHNIIIKKKKVNCECECEKKYNDLEKQYIHLNKKFEEFKEQNQNVINVINKKLLKLEEMNKEKDKKISELYSIIQSKKSESPLEEKNVEKTPNLNETPKAIINTKKENEKTNKILTDPGINCEIIVDEKKMPISLKSHINRNIIFNIKINNIGNCSIPKNCKFITKQDKDYNLIIINPKINEEIEVGKNIDIKLEMKFLDKNKVEIENKNYLEFALHSDYFGLISKWVKFYVYVKDDSQNIEKI